MGGPVISARGPECQARLAAAPETLHSMASMTTSPSLSAAFPSAGPAGLVRPASFEQLAALPDECIDVAAGAALIARDAYGSLDVDRLLARFDALAAPLVGTDLASLRPEEQADALAEHVYVTLGFRGNESDYYDAKNSLLPDVLDRKLGIPITLALVYVEIARRAGVRAQGISFPGHFLVRVDHQAESAPVIVDPFFGGRRLDTPALERMLERSAPKQTLTPDLLAPASPRTLLVRMLINLK